MQSILVTGARTLGLLWFAALLASAGCGAPCNLPKDCTGLDGYLTYYNGKLTPDHICGAAVAGSGVHFHWDTPGGTCSCDVNDPGDAYFAKWTNCRLSSMPGPPDTGDGGGGGGGQDLAGGCSISSTFACGTNSAGVQTPCSGSLVCCYVPGPGLSMTCGATSACLPPGTPGGAGDQCPSGQYQLCKGDSDCTAGYHCNAPANGYCVL